MGSFGQALFWTQAMAGIWMVSAVATHGDEIYAFMRDWMFGAPVKVAAFRRYALGEGIERKEENFAAEVAAQLGR